MTDLWRALASVLACGECGDGDGDADEDGDNELRSALFPTPAVFQIYDPYSLPSHL